MSSGPALSGASGAGSTSSFSRALNEMGGFGRGAIDAHAGFTNPGLQTGPAELGETFVQQGVEAFAAICRQRFDGHMRQVETGPAPLTVARARKND